MLEPSPFFSSGLIKQEKTATQKQTLTPQQKALIELNFGKMKRLVKNIFKRSKLYSITGLSLSGATREALTFCVEAAISFDENLSVNKQKDFASWAAHICVYRFVDGWRKLNKHKLLGVRRNKIITKLEQQSIKQFGFIDEAFILEGIIEFKKKTASSIFKKNVKMCELNSIMHVEQEEKGFQSIDQVDELDFLAKKCDTFFIKTDDENTKIRKKIVKEYIIPRLGGEEYKTLKTIAEESSISNARISQILRDDNMRSFIGSIYEDSDKNGKPIINE